MRPTKVIIAIIILALICGVSYWFFKKPNSQSPSAFAQAQPDVIQLTYANNGQLLLASDSDDNVTFWDTTSKKQVGRLNYVGRLSDEGRFVNTNKNGTLFLFSDLDKIYRTGQKVRDYHLNFIRISAKKYLSRISLRMCSFVNGRSRENCWMNRRIFRELSCWIALTNCGSSIPKRKSTFAPLV